MLFQIDEVMSWESVRNQQRMKSKLFMSQNISMQMDTRIEVSGLLEDAGQCLEEAIAEIIEGGAE
jgi:hypothetical protein